MPGRGITELESVQDLESYRDELKETLDYITGTLSSSKRTVMGDYLREVEAKIRQIDSLQHRRVEDLLRERALQYRSSEVDLDHDPSSEVRLGITWMFVPPENIRVREVRFNEDVTGLRTSANALIKSGRGQIRVDLQIDFNNSSDINNQLREVIAQFRAAPFVPIESHYIYNAVLAKALKVDPDIIEAKRLELDTAHWSYTKLRDQMLDRIFDGDEPIKTWVLTGGLKRMPNLTTKPALREYMKGLVPRGIIKVTNEWIALSGVPGLKPNFKGKIGEFNKTINKMAADVEDQIEVIRGLDQSFKKMLGAVAASIRPVLPMVMHRLEISTVPGEVNSLTANLSLLYFAHEAYRGIFSFKDHLGGETNDIGESPFYRMYLRRRFLDSTTQGGDLDQQLNDGYRYLGAYQSQSGSMMSFTFPTSDFTVKDAAASSKHDQPKFPYQDSTNVNTKAMKMVGFPGAGKIIEAGTGSLLLDPADKNLIVSRIVVALQNRVAMQPIQGHLWATAQHMGSINARVSVILHALGQTQGDHDIAVARVQNMKLEVEKVAHALGPKSRRNSKIAINNDVLALCGVRAVQIDGLTTRTVPGEILSSQIRLDMTEFTVSQDKREQLHLANPDANTTALKTALEYAIDLADRYNLTVSQIDDAKSLSRLAGAEFDLAMAAFVRTALYGIEYRNGILSDDLMTNVFLSRPEIVNAALKHAKDQKLSADRLERGRAFRRRTQHLWGRDSNKADEQGIDHPNTYKQTRMTQMETVEPDPSDDDRRHTAARRLARGAITWWNSIKDGEEGPTTKKLYGVTLTTSPGPYLNDIFETLRNSRQGREYAHLVALATHLQSNVSDLREFVEGRVKDQRSLSAYPDMDLPTYAEAFLALLDADPTRVKANQSKSAVDRIHKGQIGFRDLGPQTRALFKRFYPTYRELGKRPPVGKDPYDIARSPNDFVDPDFWFFARKISEAMDTIHDQLSGEVKDIFGENPGDQSPESQPASTQGKPWSADKSKEIRDARGNATLERLYQLKSAMPQLVLRNPEDNKTDIVTNTDLFPSSGALYPTKIIAGGHHLKTQPVPGYGVGPEYMYAPGNPDIKRRFGLFSHDHPWHLRSLFRESMQSKPDNLDRMVRAFPTYRLYFIEADNEEWGFWDDFYNYNAVIDIKLSEHKFEPTLLEIRLINVSGNLDAARSRSDDPDRAKADFRWSSDPERHKPRDPRREPDSPVNEFGTGEPGFLEKFYLRHGTNIMLKLGYGSSEEDLETKFVGQIVEIQPGDVTRIVCQSYANELTVPLNTYKKGYDSDAFDVIKWVMNASPTDHYGKFDAFQMGLMPGLNRDGTAVTGVGSSKRGYQGYRGEQGAKLARQHLSHFAGVVKIVVGLKTVFSTGGPHDPYEDALEAQTITDKVAGFIHDFSTATSTRKIHNVFVPRHSGLRELFSFSRDFIIPDRTGLEVLHELTRHLPGYVTDTRPYDHKATLFFGKPEQRYFYTDSKLDEERRWMEKKADMDRQVKHDFAAVLAKFFKSGYFRRYQKEAAGFWTSTGKILEMGAVAAWKIPGRYLNKVSFGLIGHDLETELGRWAANTYGDGSSLGDETRTLSKIQSIIAEENVKILAKVFFNKYSNRDGLRELGHTMTELMGTPDSVTRLLRVAVRHDIKDVLEAKRKAETQGVFDPNANAGTVLTSLHDWRSKLEIISSRINNDTQLLNAFEVSDDYVWLSWRRDHNTGVLDSKGHQFMKGQRDVYEKAIQSVIEAVPLWKIFISKFSDWLSAQISRKDTDIIQMAYRSARFLEELGYNPRTKRFRNYHLATSMHHIIKNGIVATKEQMANTVIVKYPSDIDYQQGGEGDRWFVKANTEWDTLEWMVDENIYPSDKKVRIITELNADSFEKAKICAWTNLAEALRPMYRGELVLRGDARIRPYDIVWVHDPYENIFGPVEVERVLTHFSSDTGYVTTIVPQAVTIPMSRSSWLDCMMNGMAWGLMGIGITLGGATVGGAVGGYGGSFVGPWTAAIGLVVGGSVFGYLSYALSDEFIQQATGAGIWGNLHGRGRYGDQRTPVDILPLARNGIPWTAGLRGFSYADWQFRLFKRFQNLKRGYKIVSPALHRMPGFEKLQNLLGL